MSLERLKAELETRQVFKAWEIEENLDRFFCRPVAVLMTAGFHAIRMTPNQVSILGMLVGTAGACLMFGSTLGQRVLAVALVWLCEVLDAADGQLARLATKPSRYGRIIDGLCGMAFYLAVYAALGIGLAQRHGTALYGWLALVAVLAHSLQASLYDFYRTEYIRIAKRREPEDPDALEALERAQPAAGARRGFTKRIMLVLYHHYVWRQAVTTPTYQPLSRAIAGRFRGGAVPEDFAERYSVEQRGMVRWWNYLGSNTHLLVLSVSILARRPEWYLWATVVGFSAYAILMTAIQARASGTLLHALERSDPDAAAARAADAAFARAQ